MRIGCGIVLCLFSLPLAAHHSFAAEFDDKQPVTLDGVVTKFDFMNPHSWIYLDVTKPDGKTEHWQVETGSTNALFRRGWRKESLRPGDHVTIDAFRAKDGFEGPAFAVATDEVGTIWGDVALSTGHHGEIYASRAYALFGVRLLFDHWWGLLVMRW